MDDLASTLATSFSVSNVPNTTAAEHPRFSQYKSKKSGSDQEARRKTMLSRQKRYGTLSGGYAWKIICDMKHNIEGCPL